jgi:hypothetical protein
VQATGLGAAQVLEVLLHAGTQALVDGFLGQGCTLWPAASPARRE